MILSCATAILCAAHRGPDGQMHGHTWEIEARWLYNGADVLDRQLALQSAIEQFDHRQLPSEVSRAEDLAAHFGLALCCTEVEVRRPLERLGAIWRA